MESRDAAGDITGRSFDINGNEIRSNISNRIISLPIEELKKKKNRIGIAIGEDKCRAILGAIRGKIVNQLYTDEITARGVLAEMSRKR